MMRRTNEGFTIIEALIALAVIGVAFAALSLILVTNLRASVSARLATDAKAAANIVLEDLLGEVLTVTEPSPGVLDFAFTDYYWDCPDPGATAPSSIPSHDDVDCDGTVTMDDIDIDYEIAAGFGVLGEGYVTIAVTATQSQRGQSITIGDRVTCYDIYPSPTVTAPAPCPVPTASGGGWL